MCASVQRISLPADGRPHACEVTTQNGGQLSFLLQRGFNVSPLSPRPRVFRTA
jgi:hypothetical protein